MVRLAISFFVGPVAALLLFLTLVSPAGESIDHRMARQLRDKVIAGQELSAEERALYEQAVRERRARIAGRQPRVAAPEPRASWPNLVPLSEMTAADEYHGEDGGLYGHGSNEPPSDHLAASLRAAAQIEPLDADGRPADTGKIGVVSIGMSNTAIHWGAVIRRAAEDTHVASQVVFVQGARGGMDAHDWAEPDERRRQDRPSPWESLDTALDRAGVSAAQVQVGWLMHARRQVTRLGKFPQHAEALRDDLVQIVQRAREMFPRLRLLYVSNRIYAGHSLTAQNPEPYAYETGFAVRWLIQQQMQGDMNLNYDPARGDVRSPVLLWGPDLWANGDRPRKSDGLTWLLADFKQRDQMHPTPAAAYAKTAPRLLDFFHSHPTSRSWFHQD